MNSVKAMSTLRRIADIAKVSAVSALIPKAHVSVTRFWLQLRCHFAHDLSSASSIEPIS